MSAAAAAPRADPHQLGRNRDHDERPVITGGGEDSPPNKRIVVGYGFWIFLISDIIMFSAFFAAYAVLSGETAGGPSGRQLFHLDLVAVETGLLLTSTFACGMAALASEARSMIWTQVALLVTGLLGLGFLALEIHEFTSLIQQGAGPQRSAFLSAFFALVGLHGTHVGIGLLWIGTMMAQILAKGFRDDIMRRLLCFTLFWHALDIVWVGVLTVVYLLGVR